MIPGHGKVLGLWVNMGICSQFTFHGLCKARHTHTHPGHCVTKQVFARLIPVCELKACIIYLIACALCKARNSNLCPGGPCAAESARQTGSPAPPEEAGASGETSFTGLFAASLLISSICELGGPRKLCISGRLVEECCVYQNWGCGVGGRQQPGLMPILSGLGHKCMMPPVYSP